MTMAVGLTFSKIDSLEVKKSEGSDHNEIDYNSLKCNLGLYTLLNLNVCIMACFDRDLHSPNASLLFIYPFIHLGLFIYYNSRSIVHKN